MRNIIVCTVVMALCGCATKPLGSDVISHIPTQFAATSFKETIARPALPLPPKGVRSELGKGDQVFSFSGYLSYYKVFELPQQARGKIHVLVTGECACLGFDKRTLVPVVYALTSTGEVVPVSAIKYSVRGGVLVDLNLDITGNGTKYILVASNNAEADRRVGDIAIMGMGGGPVMNLDVRSYPTGKFHLTYHSI